MALVTAEALELRLPTAEWTVGSYAPAQSNRLWRHYTWRRLEDEDIGAILPAALAARARQFRRCRYCGEEYPAEQTHGPSVCQDCAERHLGTAH